MSTVIATNVLSLQAQKNLNTTSANLAQSMERISSGLRINSAKDDAAGMAIGSRMTSQINGNSQAMRNASDGISLAQTAEGSLQAVTDSLQRMRTLAVQSANASNSTIDRTAIQNEVNQLVAQINTVANQASFNGVKLLDGTFNSQTFQIGANAGETVTVASIASAKADSLGVGTTSSYAKELTSTVTNGSISSGGITVNGFGVGPTNSDGVSTSVSTTAALSTSFAQTTGDITAGDLKINGISIGVITRAATETAITSGTAIAAAINAAAITNVTALSDATGLVTLTSKNGAAITITQSGTATTAKTGLTSGTYASGSDSAIAKAAAFNAVSGQTGVSASATATTRTGTAGSTGETATLGITDGDIKINGVSIGVVDGGSAASLAGAIEKGSNVAAAINAISNQTGVLASFSTTDGAVTLTAKDGRTISAEIAGSGALSGLGEVSTVATQNTYGGLKVNTTSSAGITLGGTDIAKTALTVGYSASTATFGSGISTLDVSSAGGASNAIATIDAALSQINSSRANLGAYQNRFTAVVANLETTTVNVSASRSRITDADFASETATMTRSQIMQQAGTAMLTQANQSGQSVLSLLK